MIFQILMGDDGSTIYLDCVSSSTPSILVILNVAKRSEESQRRNEVAFRRRDSSLAIRIAAQNDRFAWKGFNLWTSTESFPHKLACTMAKSLPEVNLQIVLRAPSSGIAFALQSGKADLVDRTLSTDADMTFNLSVGYVIEEGQAPDFRGPFVQGPRGGRFIYVNCGALADQFDSPWRTRIKISLAGITAKQLAECLAKPSQALRVVIAGQGKNGGPPAATVPFLSGWEVIKQKHI